MRKSTASKEEANAPVSPGPNGRQQQQSGSYSSIVGSLQAQNGTETRTARGDNPFKYGKDEMMQVYSSLVSNSDKVQHAPLDFERYEQVASATPVTPATLNEPTEEEKTLLAGNINSEQKPRRAEPTESRQNGRRDNRQNGNARDSKKHDGHRKNGDDASTRAVPQSTASNSRSTEETAPAQVTAPQEQASEPAPQETTRSQLSGRNTSRLASIGVFDTAANAPSESTSNSAWKDDKDDDVLKEAMGYAESGGQDIDRLTDMYQSQSLGSIKPQQSSQSSRGYADQYKPMSNGLPDLFPKASNNSSGYAQAQQAGPPRGAFMESTPSPGLQARHDPPMSRVMVMPDKLKWQYRDPTGQNQGPFSGLEMHDWYKAGFFQPNLLVKREEDEDFEPLSILVRRIGNQREPFLVPLPSRVSATAQPARSGSQDGKDSWPNGQNWSGGGQPPFPQSFPSFGTTLTAEQQNALERRKQEEQYLMHRQREFLQQQQMAQQMAAQRLLHHQNPYGHGGQQYGYGMDRRGSPFSNGSERHGAFDGGAGGGNAGWGGGYAQQNQNAQRGQYADFGAGIFDTPKSEVAEQSFREPERVAAAPSRDDFTNNNNNNKSFASHRSEQSSSTSVEQQKNQQSDYAMRMAQQAQAMQQKAEEAAREFNNATQSKSTSDFADSQTEPIGTSKSNAATQAQLDSPVALAREDLRANSPAAAPQVETPSTPSAAPWAAATSTKGKSLREIQEIEAKRDALRQQAERKAAREAQAQAEATLPPVAPSVNVPLNWAADHTGEQATTPGAAWKASTPSAGKKTFAQIQLEEETAARKALAAAQARAATTQTTTQPVSSTMGTRYADTAMKTSGPSWSTVGANGRVSSAAPVQRAVEPKVVTPAAPALKPRTAPAPVVQHKPSDPDAISPEFFDWARSALRGLNPGVNFAEFLQLLLSFGTDGGKDTREIISDSIYANSATLDGRRFADEFCSRRREDLKNTHGQNKSITELTSTLASSSSAASSSSYNNHNNNNNGWSDVVKTKPARQETAEEEWNSSFKLQAKKGGKRK